MGRRRTKSESGQDRPPDEAGTPGYPAYRVTVLVEQEGACPFEKWVYGVRDGAAQARIVARLVRIALHGNFGDHRERVSGAISELKIDYGPGYRIYYALYANMIVVLVGGGVKATQTKDIEAASTLWEENKEYAERFQREFGSHFH